MVKTRKFLILIHPADGCRVAEIRHWVQVIGDCREACQRFTDSIRTSLHRTEVFRQTATNPRPATRALTDVFKHSLEHTYASYLDIWKEFDEESSPYHKLARLTEGEQAVINTRIRDAWAVHDYHEEDVLAKREEFVKVRQQYQQEKKKVPRGGTKTYDEKHRCTDLKSKMKMALVKYRIAFRDEHSQRNNLRQRLREIEEAWQTKEMVNLRLLGETLRIFKHIIFDLAPDDIRTCLSPTLDTPPMERREMRNYIRMLYGSAKKTRQFLTYEGPTITNPTLRIQPWTLRTPGQKEEPPRQRVIQEGWGPFKKFVYLTPSATRILDSPEDYIEEFRKPAVRKKVTQVASLVSRLQNVQLVATQYHLQGEPREISLTPGTTVVQVKSANEKGMSYGYKRGKLGLRKYGYYPADAVALN